MVPPTLFRKGTKSVQCPPSSVRPLPHCPPTILACFCYYSSMNTKNHGKPRFFREQHRNKKKVSTRTAAVRVEKESFGSGARQSNMQYSIRSATCSIRKYVNTLYPRVIGIMYWAYWPFRGRYGPDLSQLTVTKSQTAHGKGLLGEDDGCCLSVVVVDNVGQSVGGGCGSWVHTERMALTHIYVSFYVYIFRKYNFYCMTLRLFGTPSSRVSSCVCFCVQGW